VTLVSRGRLRAAILAAAVGIAPAACARPAPPAAPTTTAAEDSRQSSAGAPSGPQSGQSGATLTIDTGSGSASYTVGNWRAVPVDAQIIPAKGAMYAVDVRIVATRGTVDVNGFYFAARTAEGSTIAPAVGAVRPGITYGQLTSGQSVQGHVAFDVAPGAAVTGVVLRDPDGKQLGFWSLS
jgi:hypothetical protein